MFPDPWIHMGGDEVFTTCWDLRPQIKQFMLEKEIADYNQLQVYYRKRTAKTSLRPGKT